MAGASVNGGWPYYSGKRSRLEPTSWALLALSSDNEGARSDWLANHHSFLARSQRADGLLVEDPDLPPNIAFNALAALALLQSPEGQSGVITRLMDALILVKGTQLPSSIINDTQDNKLQGWPWIDTTFSWVEPTGWCLLALKKYRLLSNRPTSPQADSRIREAEQLLINRSCRLGGWNYGNSRTLGQDLQPYIPTTAIGLLAMQDHRKLPVIARGLDYLQAHRHDESSGMALALTLICLRLYGLPTHDLEEHLLAQVVRANLLSNFHITALVLYSLIAEQDGAAAFRL